MDEVLGRKELPDEWWDLLEGALRRESQKTELFITAFLYYPFL